MGPQRTCVGCRKVREKEEFFRFILNDTGELTYDPMKILPGRGTYLCKDKMCIKVALKKKRFSYSFRKQVRDYTFEEIWDMVNREW